jgi:hypothetical protein
MRFIREKGFTEFERLVRLPACWKNLGLKEIQTLGLKEIQGRAERSCILGEVAQGSLRELPHPEGTHPCPAMSPSASDG